MNIMHQGLKFPHFQVNGNDIDLVNETNYLGLMIHDNLNWRALLIVQRSYRTFQKYGRHYVQEATFRTMHFSIVQPHLSYCCSVCLPATKVETLQKLQNRAASIAKGSSFGTPAAPLLRWLCWPSVDTLNN